MTSTATAPASGPPVAVLRRNGYGVPCPSWCAIDHSKPFQDVCVRNGGSIGNVWASSVRDRVADRVGVNASLPDVSVRWPSLSLDLTDAEDLAVIVELLADATPERHRELAAAIRQAAAAITEADGA